MPPKKKAPEPVKPKAEKKKPVQEDPPADEKDEEEEEEVKADEPKTKGKGKKKIIAFDASQPTLTSSFNFEVKFTAGDGKFSQDKIKISSFNVNGLRAIMGKKDLLNYLVNDKPDVLCLNETKIDQKSFETTNIQNEFPKDYNCYWNFCKPPRSGYSGVAIISKVRPISIKHDLGIPKHDQEGRTLTLEFDKFYLVSCYVPNAGQKLDRLSYRTKEWDSDFRNFLVNLNKTKPVILCGDLNVAHHEIDISNPKGNKRSAGFTEEERAEFTKLLDLGFVDTFRNLYPKVVKYSYFNMRGNARAENKGWRLDYFVASKRLVDGGAVEDSLINNEIYGSDHTPIELKLNLSKI